MSAYMNYQSVQLNQKLLNSIFIDPEIKDGDINEMYIPHSEIFNLNPILEASKSICKIITPEGQGSGFLIKLFKRNEDFFCLMTNEHVIKKFMIDKEDIINIYYNEEKSNIKISLNPNERIIEIFTHIGIDLSVVEILFTDLISTKFFLTPSIYYMENYAKLKYQNITIIQFPKGKFGFSNGKIEDIEIYKFSYSASTDYGSSGSPILLRDTTKVIGIHSGRGGLNDNEYSLENHGFFIGPVYKYFKELPKNIYKSDNNIFNFAHGSNNLLISRRRFIRNPINYNTPPFNNNYNFNNLIPYNSYDFKKNNYDDETIFGKIKKSLYDRKGKEDYENGNIKYEGDLVNGIREGNGKFYYVDG